MDVDLTIVEVTVRGRDGQLVTDLRQEEFQISEKSTAVRLEQFAIDRQPLTVALMIQATGDMPVHREWAERLVDALGDDDRLKIGSYGTEVAVSPVLTSDRQVLRRILDEEVWYGYWVPVAAAFHSGAVALPQDVARPTVVLIGTDPTNEDACNPQQPCMAINAARQAILQRGVLAYAIVTGLGYAMGPNKAPQDVWSQAGGPARMADGRLQALAKETGGYLSTRNLQKAAWPEATKAVLEQLRVRYVLGFVPRSSGLIDDVTFKVARSGTTVRVQKSRTVRRQP